MGPVFSSNNKCSTLNFNMTFSISNLPIRINMADGFVSGLINQSQSELAGQMISLDTLWQSIQGPPIPKYSKIKPLPTLKYYLSSFPMATIGPVLP